MHLFINKSRVMGPCLYLFVQTSSYQYLFKYEINNTNNLLSLFLRFWRALSSHVSKIDQTESAIHISGCTLEDSFQGREVIKKKPGSITIRILINWKKCVTNNWILSLTWRVKFVIKRDLYNWIFIHKSQFCKGKGKSQLLAWERLFWEPPYV